MMATNHGGLCHAEEVCCASHGCGTANAGRGRCQVERLVAKGAAGSSVAEGRCRQSMLDGCRNRRCVRLPNENGREYSRTVRHRRLRSYARRQAAGRAASEVARWRARSQGHCDALGAAAGGFRELDLAVVGRAGGRARNCGIDQPRNRASHAQKNGMTKRKIEYWVIPPETDGEFVAATKDHPRRVDYEYERAGTASIFMFCEPLSGWRQVAVRERRTKIDWAREIEELLRTRYASADKVLLVCDNLNTHTQGAFYDAFDPQTARAVLSRLESHYTPKHGSWLNVAENELSSMTRQCLKDRRFGTIEELRKETTAWHSAINDRQRGVDWQFRIDDARAKLTSVYPKIIV